MSTNYLSDSQLNCIFLNVNHYCLTVKVGLFLKAFEIWKEIRYGSFPEAD